jgi:molybdopterin synthase catalytic subunit
VAVWTHVGPESIDPAAVLARVGTEADGAVVLFVGIVRDHAEGRPVSGMTYEAYTSMASSELAALAGEAAERWRTDRVAVVHRTGALTLGEPSVAIAVSTPHRAEAYEASRWIIEAIKVRLPIWKHEHFTDGESRWVPGRTPPTPAAP